jgi:flagellar L-ring protein precursor FlgH
LTGCGATERLSRIGQVPALSPVVSPTLNDNYRPVTMPMPTPYILSPSPNSLWRPGARAFFEDQRAKQVGDVLTVVVNIQNERAQLSNQTSRNRTGSEQVEAPNVLGLNPSFLQPPGIGGPSLDVDSTSAFTGTGTVNRSESINLRLAAIVTQILPNGNLAIVGKQEVRVNGDVRELQVAGVLRPEDVRSDNTITWDKIAEARIAYGGRGTITDVQQPRYGQQIFDVLFPF